MSKLILQREFKGEPVTLLQVPQGTALFRYMNEADSFRDFAGIYQKDSDTYCLGKNHSVWFFPYPYVADTNPYMQKIGYNTYNIYVTTHDLLVALFIKPSPKLRTDAFKKTDPIVQACNQEIFCNQEPGKISDPCFKDEFILENPDVVGTLSISFKDMMTFKGEYFKGKLNDFKKFIAFFREDKGLLGVPEFGLYPRRIRTLETITTKYEGYEWINKHLDEFNFFPFESFSHKQFEKDTLYKFMQQSLSPKGYSRLEDKKYHLTIDLRTYFYVLKEASEEETQKHCLPLSDFNKVKQLTFKNKKLIFDLAKLFPKKK